ncbi:MAG: pentapeptide repeat-containing protein [Myxococcota bacterium]
MYQKTLALLFVFLLLPAVSNAVTFSLIGTSGGTPSSLEVGETVTFDIRVDADADSVAGLSASIYGYNEAVVDFVQGDAVPSIFHGVAIPGVGAFSGLSNIAPNPLEESAIGANGNRVQIFNGVALTPVVAQPLDPGLDGNVGGGDAQFRVTFTAVATGTTQLLIGTGYEADRVILAGGLEVQANGFSVVVTVGAGLDSDEDGLPDSAELNIYGTDPQDPDSDDDGLNDGDEVNVHSTNPLVADSDGDLLSDGDEVNLYVTNPLVEDAGADTDGDGLTNVAEADIYFTDPSVSDAEVDTDGDGLSNVEEVDTYGTDLAVADTDGDGVSDGDEVNLAATDPLSENFPGLVLNDLGDSGADIFSAIETDGIRHWVTVWQSSDTLGGTVGSDFDILTSRSSDGGATWTAPAALNSNAATDGVRDNWPPAVRTDGSGVWIAAWSSFADLSGTIGADSDILFARSLDNGATWSAPSAIDSGAGSDSGDDDRVSIGYGNGAFVALWQSNDASNGGDLDIRISRSTDGGLSWTPSALLNTNAAGDIANDTLPTLATDDSGNWVAIWESDESLIGGDGDLFVSRSSDNGATWSPTMILNANAIGDFGADRRPKLATDTLGIWVVVWDTDDDFGGSLGTDRDVVFSRSINNGASWTFPAAVDSSSFSDAGDEINPSISTDQLLAWTVVWESDENVRGVLGTDFDLLVSRSEDDGASWSAARSLKLDGASDLGGDFFPQIATQPEGSTVVVWHSDDDIAGAGTDFDIHTISGLFLVDTDEDGLSNADESNLYGTDPNVSDADADTDGDGLTNVEEVDVYQTDFALSDTDGDGLEDGEEVSIYLTNPLLADTDGDELTDGDEVNLYATNPNVSDADADTDGDGLTNVAEVDVHSTDPLEADTDMDGLIDGEEVNTYFTNPLLTDTDGDRVSDGDEVNLSFTDPLTPNAPGFVLNRNSEIDSGADIFSSVETDGFGNWVTVWRSTDDLEGTIEADSDILMARSSNGGASWSAPEALNTNAASDSASDFWPAAIKTDRQGVWIAAWPSASSLGGTIGTDRDILFARSIDRGATWSDPSALNSGAAIDSGSDDRVALAYGNGVFLALWQSDDGAAGPDLDIKISRSVNGGQTWSAAVAIDSNSVSDLANDSFPTLATDGMGNWVAVWETDQSLIGGDGDLLTARSSDAGVTWTTPAIVNSNALSDTGSDLRPRLATDGFGTWILTWDSDENLGGMIGQDRDILFSRSVDEGTTWSDPQALQAFSASDAGDEANARPTTDITGAWSVVFDADEDLTGQVGTDFDLFSTSSVDDGMTWLSAIPLNPDAEIDSGGDFFPGVATQPGGASVVVWHSDEDANLAIGTDWDLFFVNDLQSARVTDCAAVGPFVPSTGTLGFGENHFCEDWSLVSQPGSDLRDSFFVGADFSGAALGGALLIRSDFAKADLSNASLFNAGLSEAIFAGANLTGADLAFADLGGSFYDQDTLFPSGSTVYSGTWGLPNDVAPWDLGMVPVPEPSLGLGLLIGGGGLLGVTRFRRVSGRATV